MNRIFILAILTGLLYIIGCSSTTQKEKESPAEKKEELEIDLTQVDAMQLIYTDDEDTVRYLTENDRVTLARLLKDAKYDSKWNDSDIMIHMIAPDYTVIVSYREMDSENDDWLMIWRNSEHVKFKNIWYILDQEKNEEASHLLEGYRNVM